MNYNILIIDDDPLVLSDTRLMYEEMIEFGDLNDIFPYDATGTISTATNTREAEIILADNFTNEPNLVQVIHVDQRMPGETGSEFIDRMRWTYAGRRVGALLVTGYSTDASVQNSREAGVYRFISKPVTAQLIKPHLNDLVKVIFSREKPLKKTCKKDFYIKIINAPDELSSYFQLRYSVFDSLNYLQQKNDRHLDIDKFDPYSTHLAAFENGKAVASIRIVSRTKQEHIAMLIDEILYDNPTIKLTDTFLTKFKLKSLNDFINLPRRQPLPCAETFPLEDFINEINGDKTIGEFSRIIDHPDYRGYGLSKGMILAAITISKFFGGPDLIFGACVPQHVEMYAKYGWKLVPKVELKLEKKVQQVARVMFADIHKDIDENIIDTIKELDFDNFIAGKEILYPFRNSRNSH